ncbi:porin family protein [Mucilaginibacter myungsuensis]|uniref:TonB dependent receptor n=1 Tax=Mucilaginibacter myungsuensis TaxID=649104 RepID=A0A929KZQ3_9SPHI|nr:hypothetical protein [Mucilaginibacter myungsuensis]MBE9663587.1 hypothetical protein [Mucilaginibacter myungsuensis]MDN3599089.1 hypothetical protein [Mucilaginibacter myungsuensis]
MKFKHTYALLILGMAIAAAPVQAQTNKNKKDTKAPVKKPAPAKPAATKPAAQSAIKNLGDAASNVKIDTVKKTGDEVSESNLSQLITITTAYKPVLADAVKIRRNPDMTDKEPYKAPLTYTPMDKRLERNTDIKQMEPMKMPLELDSIPYNNMVKGGFGNLKTTFGEVYINNGRDAALQTGVYAKHFAQSGTAFANQKQSRNEIGVFGKSIGEVNSIKGSISYSNRANYFYGYDNQEPLVAKLNNNRQAFSLLSAQGELTKNFKDVERDFTYALKLSGYLYSDAFKASESNVVVSGFINQTIKQFYAGLNASIDMSTPKDSLYSLNNTLVRANPYLKFQGENYKVDVGVNIVGELGFSQRVFVFPAARLEFQVIPKYVRLFAEAKGDVNKASIRDFTEINPFLGKNINIRNSVDQLDLAAGLKGTIAPGLGFKASVFRNQVKNMPFMVSNFDFVNGNNRFTVIYDGGNAKINGFNGELDFKASADLDIFGRIELKDYKMATEAEAWNLPKFKLTAGTTIHISDKVNFNASLFFRDNTVDRIADPTTPGATRKATVSSFADFSAGAEYKVNKRFGVFAQANNLINGNYSQWLFYPNYGFNLFGGVSYSF